VLDSVATYCRKLLPSLVAGCHQLRHLRHLVLHGLELEQVPDTLFSLPACEVLDISNNALPAVTETLGCLSSLRQLDLSGNGLTTLPASVVRGVLLVLCCWRQEWVFAAGAVFVASQCVCHEASAQWHVMV
jgi:hypothetical protein